MLRANLQYALRNLRKRPWFALAAIVTTALGIGAGTAVFSVVYSVLVRPLPYQDPDRLVAIWPRRSLANGALDALRTRAHSYGAVAAFSPGWLIPLTEVSSPRQLNAARVSGNTFAILGVAAAVGRTFGFEAEAPGEDRVAVLSDELWRSEYRADPSIVGRSIRLDGVPYLVTGVMPPSFTLFDVATDLWLPLTMDQSLWTWTAETGTLFGRLRPEASVASATAELGVVMEQYRVERTLASDWARGARVEDLRTSLVGGTATLLAVLLGAVACLLMIAVANVAGLFSIRNTERRQELAVRASLGATGRQLTALLVTENLILGTLGGAIGVVIALLGVGAIRRMLPGDLPRAEEIAVDGSVLAMAAIVTLVAALIQGLVSAIPFTARTPTSIRPDQRVVGPGNRARGVLVAVEVALAVVLAVGTMLMARTMISLTRVDPGLDAGRLLTMRLQPAGLQSQEALRVFWREALARLRETPGVEAAASILHLPTSGRTWQADVEVDGRPVALGTALPRTAWQSVSTGYFEAAGVPLLRGRTFDAGDRTDAEPVMAVNRAFAELIFPGEDPIGKRVRADHATGRRWATIVGLVGGVRHDGLSIDPRPEIYLPFEQLSVGASAIIIRTKGDPEALAPLLKDRIWEINRNVPISQVRTMDDLFAASLGRPRLILGLLGIFAATGLVLGAIGIYGVAAYWARQRRREIAIRVALGADQGRIVRLVVGHGSRFAAAGVVAGAVVAFGLTRVMRGLVFGVPVTDPMSFAVAAAVLLAAAMVATWIPARRAAEAEPSLVLKDQ